MFINDLRLFWAKAYYDCYCQARYTNDKSCLGPETVVFSYNVRFGNSAKSRVIKGLVIKAIYNSVNCLQINALRDNVLFT